MKGIFHTIFLIGPLIALDSTGCSSEEEEDGIDTTSFSSVSAEDTGEN